MKATKRNGKWYKRVSYYDQHDLDKNGKPKRKFASKQGFQTKRQADEWAVEFLHKVNNGLNADQKVIPSFADYFWQWAQTYRFPAITDVTKHRYEVNHKVLEDYFGDKKINKISRTEYQKFLNSYAANHAPDTAGKLASMMKACLDSAVADRLLTVNFSIGTKISGNKDKNLTVKYPSVEQIKKMVAATISLLRPYHVSYYMILTSIATGMRIGEVGGLTWQDIDFKKQTISINKAYRYRSIDPVLDDDIRFKPLKNDSSYRIIKANTDLLGRLNELKQNKYELVFSSPLENGKVPSPASVSHALKRVLKPPACPCPAFTSTVLDTAMLPC